jgi:hypothetical protein
MTSVALPRSPIPISTSISSPLIAKESTRSAASQRRLKPTMNTARKSTGNVRPSIHHPLAATNNSSPRPQPPEHVPARSTTPGTQALNSHAQELQVVSLSQRLQTSVDVIQEDQDELIAYAQRFYLHAQKGKSVSLRGRRPTTASKFESIIRSNTQEEEKAPRMHIVNEVDDEPCPKLDFHWTNDLVYGKGVPRPVASGQVEGCECPGPCEISGSRGPGACSCLKKQALELAAAHPGARLGGTIYDSKGCLKELGTRIVECNSNCFCAANCKNKVGPYCLKFLANQR